MEWKLQVLRIEVCTDLSTSESLDQRPWPAAMFVITKLFLHEVFAINTLVLGSAIESAQSTNVRGTLRSYEEDGIWYELGP